MQRNVLELEEILDSQIDVYSKIEKCMIDKKDVLVKGDIDTLRTIDSKIDAYVAVAEKLEKKSQSISVDFNSGSTLSEIINRIPDSKKSEKLSVKLINLKETLLSIKRYNDINAQLIKHSLKLIEHSVFSIANVLMPEKSNYNNYGKIRQSGTNSTMTVSSISREA